MTKSLRIQKKKKTREIIVNVICSYIIDFLSDAGIKNKILEFSNFLRETFNLITCKVIDVFIKCRLKEKI